MLFVIIEIQSVDQREALSYKKWQQPWRRSFFLKKKKKKKKKKKNSRNEPKEREEEKGDHRRRCGQDQRGLCGEKYI
jgi:hypothetical protein